jgi:nucleotide-binding universal stress UspA family protein
MKGWAPIELYQLGDAYFVVDGNHRVSVARQLGSKTISAIVTEVKTDIPVSKDDDPTEIISRANYREFQEQTSLLNVRPDADLSMTFCDKYPYLLDQIEEYRQRIEESQNCQPTLQEAAARWYDEVYLPVVQVIREQGILHNFRHRTEADLFVLISEQREELEEALGWQINAQAAAFQLSPEARLHPARAVRRIGERFMDAFVPGLGEGPPPGHWRRFRQLAPRRKSLFQDILVSLQGTEADWCLLQEALKVASREDGRILALHAIDHESEVDRPEVIAIRERFEAHCAEADIPGQLAVEVGNEGSLMLKRSAWVDLVATNLTFASEATALSPIGGGVISLIQRCPRPILVFSCDGDSALDNVLLAYDGSPKAQEALYVAAYLAGRWPIRLSVVTVETKHTSEHDLEKARAYLEEQGLGGVHYELHTSPIWPAILDTTAELETNLLIMGGFGFRPVRHLMLGSTVDEALRSYRRPMLICR